MRFIENPPNPFQTEYVEWIGPPPKAKLHVYEEEAKSILSGNESPDIPFRWSLNPYRGCFHACAYCYARPSHEYLGFGSGSDFESKIVVKTNAPNLLKKAFLRPKWKGEMIAFSGDTDCYQPLEACWKLTRQCLEVCAEFQNPVGIITKSPLIRRDVDILQQMTKTGHVHVLFSIGFIDDQQARKVEPQAPLPSSRFEAMKVLAKAGIPCGLLLAPIIPGLNENQIPEILKKAKDSGARSAGHILLRLPGNVRNIFFERMKKEFPQRINKIEGLIRESRKGAISNSRFFERHRGQGQYWNEIDQLFKVYARRLGFNRRIDTPQKTTFRRPGANQLMLFEG